ncbi:hypothetical protein E2650_12340 [Shewanella xiamenensis]|uniref:Uncharacterized protein n=1 Tax=Shewanella xiamenensis TaxID=332186 RepID=A0AAW6QYC6_9GAMM|nr:hypothetical protein [Shewanella xiamenensis]
MHFLVCSTSSSDYLKATLKCVKLTTKEKPVQHHKSDQPAYSHETFGFLSPHISYLLKSLEDFRQCLDLKLQE